MRRASSCLAQIGRCARRWARRRDVVQVRGTAGNLELVRGIHLSLCGVALGLVLRVAGDGGLHVDREEELALEQRDAVAVVDHGAGALAQGFAATAKSMEIGRIGAELQSFRTRARRECECQMMVVWRRDEMRAQAPRRIPSST